MRKLNEMKSELEQKKNLRKNLLDEEWLDLNQKMT